MTSKGPPPGYTPYPPPQGGHSQGPPGAYPQGPPPQGYPAAYPAPQPHGQCRETTYVVVNSHNCPHCHCGTLHDQVHVVGVILAVLLYFVIGPCSLFFLLWRCERCDHCGYTI